ncbi:nuclear transport factor 2 family protein [Amycolatopsis echigonensis]|uniref:Nuclear transport factor 2 family protein n=1 Tax=Amycolatopsis echigonensis TaxID=2576905 RepID=A0A8E1W6S0_9PSEU|nr:nuclear transport factor 2 family protein [Amycolatopsis echigonensis]MBB2505136.1 nuclear transport factor 2 family protein [Amycolatopsis echigonensis]
MTESTDSARVAESFLPYHEVHRIHGAYTEYLDSGQHDLWLDLFTVDGSLTVREEVYSGRSGLRRFLAGRGHHAGTHFTGPPIFLGGTVSHCVVKANFLALKRTESGIVVSAVGTYHDELRVENGGWWIAARRVHIGVM